MERIVFYLVLGLFLLSFSNLADTNTLINCAADEDCLTQLGVSHYCNDATETCFRRTPPPVPPINQTRTVSSPITPASANPALEQKVGTLDQTVQALKGDTATINSDLTVTKRDIVSLRETITGLQGQLSSISDTINTLAQDVNFLKTQFGLQLDQALSGQAVLQEDLNITKVELSEVKEGLFEQQTTTKVFTFVFLLLLAVAIFIGIVYYLNHGKDQSGLDSKVAEYLTTLIKQGKRYPDIKNTLLKAGWLEKDITLAYKETLKQTLGKQKIEKSALGADKSKMIVIIGIAILLIVGGLFILRGTTGKAIFFEKSLKPETKEILYSTQCTPPHILTPSKDGCCLDFNSNTICDNQEREVTQAQEGHCLDNLQCSPGQSCINRKCGSLSKLYQGSVICDKLCNYYSLRVSTSDGESYTVKANRGSYTAAGAVEWKVLESPEHCKGEGAIVPITIIKKEPKKILSENVITLRRGETSEVITHPTLPNIHFTLTLTNIYELCT